MALAAVDWVAVWRGLLRAEAILKPLVPLPLIAVALTAHSWWFAAALALCLAGDVLLLPQVDRFRSGLAAFLLGHAAFIAAFLMLPVHPDRLIAAPPILAMALLLAPRIVRAAPNALRAPIVVYMVVVLAMFGAALLAGGLARGVGAALFVISDTLLALNRFVAPQPGGRVAVMVTYHLAIGLLTLSLLF